MDNDCAKEKMGTAMVDSRRLVRWLLIAVVVSVLLDLAADLVFGWAFPLNPDAIEEWLSGAGPWAPLL